MPDRLITVNVKSNTRIPASLLQILPGQLLRHQVDMVQHATRKPGQNRTLIGDYGLSTFGLENSQTTQDSAVVCPNSPIKFHADLIQPALFGGLQVDSTMLRIPTQQMDPPELVWNGKVKSLTAIEAKDGAWDLKDRQFFKPARTGLFTYLFLRDGKTGKNATNLPSFAKLLKDAPKRYGMNAALQELGNNHTLLLGPAKQQDLIGRFKGYAAKKITAVIVILPSKDSSLYAMVKKVGDRTCGIQTICHVAKTSTDEKDWGPSTNQATLANLMLKLNLKMGIGSVNHTLKVMPALLKRTTMLMGIDVTHAGASAQTGAPSIAAVVGSINEDFFQYPAVICANPRLDASGKPTEVVSVLKGMVKTSIQSWSKKNGARLPEKLIIYRDGLSEQQFKTVALGAELTQIKAALKDLAKDADPPKILLICSVKQHHTRFYKPESGADDSLFDKNDNVKPGLLVDSDIVHGEDEGGRHDFFLVSHKTLIGTTKPTHYVTLLNELDATRQDVAEMVCAPSFCPGHLLTSCRLTHSATFTHDLRQVLASRHQLTMLIWPLIERAFWHEKSTVRRMTTSGTQTIISTITWCYITTSRTPCFTSELEGGSGVMGV